MEEAGNVFNALLDTSQNLDVTTHTITTSFIPPENVNKKLGCGSVCGS